MLLSFQRISEQVQSAAARTSEHAQEVLSNMRTVRSFANEPAEELAYTARLLEVLRLKIKLAAALAGFFLTNDVCS